jgi:hypothetical protein
MKYIYYIDGKKFTTDEYVNIPFDIISSPDENTPAWEDLTDGEKGWCKKGYVLHRLIGPAKIWADSDKWFYLNGIHYTNIKDWLKAHPNQDNTFQIEMLLKYS